MYLRVEWQEDNKVVWMELGSKHLKINSLLKNDELGACLIIDNSVIFVAAILLSKSIKTARLDAKNIPRLRL